MKPQAPRPTGKLVQCCGTTPYGDRCMELIEPTNGDRSLCPTHSGERWPWRWEELREQRAREIEEFKRRCDPMRSPLMTHDEWLREIELLVAREIMGHREAKRFQYRGEPRVSSIPPHASIPFLLEERYPLDIAAAWKVVEKMIAVGPLELRVEDDWAEACFVGGTNAQHEEVAVAICLSALLTRGIEVPEEGGG